MKRAIAAVAVAAVAGVTILVLATGGDPAPARAAAHDTSTATVERRDLVDRDTVQGTLGYADASRSWPARPARSTRLRDPGAVVRRGQSLYDVDDAAAAWLFYGSLPAWRDFGPSMSDGEDVRQLERNLRALGYDPDHDMTIDDDWTWATTAAVERFQDARDMTEDGTLTRGEVVFRPGPARIGETRATVGQSVAPGAQIGERPRRSARSPSPCRPIARTSRTSAPTSRSTCRTGAAPAAGSPTSRRWPTSRRPRTRTPTIGGHDRDAWPCRPRHRARPGAGRRRLRARAPQARPRGAGHRAARPLRRRVRARGPGRPRSCRSRRARTPTITSRSAAQGCARA